MLNKFEARLELWISSRYGSGRSKNQHLFEDLVTEYPSDTWEEYIEKVRSAEKRNIYFENSTLSKRDVPMEFETTLESLGFPMTINETQLTTAAPSELAADILVQHKLPTNELENARKDVQSAVLVICKQLLRSKRLELSEAYDKVVQVQAMLKYMDGVCKSLNEESPEKEKVEMKPSTPQNPHLRMSSILMDKIVEVRQRLETVTQGIEAVKGRLGVSDEYVDSVTAEYGDALFANSQLSQLGPTRTSVPFQDDNSSSKYQATPLRGSMEPARISPRTFTVSKSNSLEASPSMELSPNQVLDEGTLALVAELNGWDEEEKELDEAIGMLEKEMLEYNLAS